ncbi:MAG: hypothetical protein HY326_04625 [Chloroflexi bacterium]|nr:hypothetical protein [Chloroflexota bacterium]
MTEELNPVDISNMPELLRLAEEVRDTGEPRVLRRDSEDLAIMTPVKPTPTKPRKSRSRRNVFTPDDPLWNIVGIGHSEGPGDVSENKHKYLAEAYTPKTV